MPKVPDQNGNFCVQKLRIHKLVYTEKSRYRISDAFLFLIRAFTVDSFVKGYMTECGVNCVT